MMYAVRQDPESHFWQVHPVDRMQGEALLERGYPHVYETTMRANAVRTRLNIEYGVAPVKKQDDRQQHLFVTHAEDCESHTGFRCSCAPAPRRPVRPIRTPPPRASAPREGPAPRVLVTPPPTGPPVPLAAAEARPAPPPRDPALAARTVDVLRGTLDKLLRGE